ncbi:MAG: sigma-70 family RNA polymerase sigma factor [Ardenticatenales bacterium]
MTAPSMFAPGDDILVARTLQGDGHAFGLLVRRHQDAVYSLCYHLSGDAAEAEDLAQEAFLRCHAQLGRFRTDAPLWPWLRRLTVHSALNGLRSRRGRPRPVSLDSAAHPDQGALDVPADAHGQALGRTEAAAGAWHGGVHGRIDLERLLADLAPTDRAILVLRYLEDLPYADIAAALDVPVSTVETRLFRARKRAGELYRDRHRADVEVQHAATKR